MRKEALSTKAMIDGLERFLALEPRSRVLELGCGSGRRTLELARRGHRVMGVDADERALALARAALKNEKLNVHFLKVEASAINYRGELDAVVSLDGAFGQSPSDREDLRCLEAVRGALKPGGKFLVDVLNRESLLRHFEPNSWERAEERESAVVLDRISFDFEKGRLDNHRTIVHTGGKRTPSFLSVRVYKLTELKAQLGRAGLVYRQCWGGFDGSSYGMESPRLVVLAARGKEERAAKHEDDDLPTAIRIKGRRTSR